MADKGNDPAAIWQTMIGEMEKGFNAFANQAMTSPEFSRLMNQVGGVSAGLNKQLADLMEKYLTSMNLPSRAQMTSLGERLQTLESQVSEIMSMLRQLHPEAASPRDGHTPAPKPPRTKRPPSAGGTKA
jgi:poly(hydroxyalkanoate) synthase III subunit E